MTDANPTNPPAPSPDAVVDNRDASRFELVVDGQTAVAEYRRSGQTIDFTHTEVPEALFSQLKPNGRLVALLATPGKPAVAHLFARSGKGIASRAAFDAILPPLAAKRDDSFVF